MCDFEAQKASFMVQFEAKKQDFKSSLNQLVDDFFGSLFTDISAPLMAQFLTNAAPLLDATSQCVTFQTLGESLPLQTILPVTTIDEVANNQITYIQTDVQDALECQMEPAESIQQQQPNAQDIVNLQMETTNSDQQLQPQAELEQTEFPSGNDESTTSTAASGDQSKEFNFDKLFEIFLEDKPPEQAQLAQAEKETAGLFNEHEYQYRILVHGIKCPKENCGLMFGDTQLLNGHITSAHQECPYPCPITDCAQQFVDATKLAIHGYMAHSQLTEFRCQICSRSSPTFQSLLFHSYNVHQEGLFQCSKPFCAFVASNRQDIKLHLQSQHPKFACPYPECDFVCDRASRLQIHQRKHTHAKPFRCTYPGCERRFGQKSGTIRHIRVDHFLLPDTLRKQKALNIRDERDPSIYLVVDHTQL